MALQDNIWELFGQGGALNPDATAVISCHQRPGHLQSLTIQRLDVDIPPEERDLLSWSYRQLLVACQRVSRILIAHDVCRGDRVATLLDNGIESAVISWVAVNLQLTLVPLAEGVFVSDEKDEMAKFVSSLNCQELDMIMLTLEQMDATCSSIYDPVNPEALDMDEFPQDPNLEDGGDRTALICCMKGNMNREPKGKPVHVSSLVANLLVTAFKSKSSGVGRMLISALNYRPGWWNDTIMTWRHGGGVIFPPAGYDGTLYLAVVEHFGGPSAVSYRRVS